MHKKQIENNKNIAAIKVLLPAQKKGAARVESTHVNASLDYDWVLDEETRRIGKAGVKLAQQALRSAA